MKHFIIGTAVLGGFAALTAWNYRQRFPAPRPVCTPGNRVEIRKVPVRSGGHQLYGELLLPEDARGPLPTIICSHGFGGSYRHYKSSVGMCLAMSGFAVYCFDFYGGSTRSKSGGSMTEMSVFTERNQLHDVIRTIKSLEVVDAERLFLLGESLGGFVTAATAAQHTDDIAAIALFYPAFCAKDDMLKSYRSLEEVPEIVHVRGRRVGRIYYQDLFAFDIYKEISAYTRPVLIVHGDADRVVNISYGEAAANAYANARLEILPGEDHGFSARGKLQAAELVYQFLRKYC